MSKKIETPQLAKERGMTVLVFEDDFDSLETIDVNNTGDKGYKWYVERPYKFTTLTEGEDYKVEDSVLTLCNKDATYNYGIGTYHPTKKNGWSFCKGYLEFRIRIPRNRSGRRGRRNPAQSAGVRHDDALDVLDDVAGHLDKQTLRQRAEHGACLRRRVRDGDRFGTAHCGTQFLIQNGDIVLIARIRRQHLRFSFASVLRLYHTIFAKQPSTVCVQTVHFTVDSVM